MSDQDNQQPNDDVFTTPSPASNSSGVEDLLAQIKNENGEQKYKNLEDAIKGLKASQEFIPQILNEKRQMEDELARLREVANKQESIDEVLAKLKTAGQNEENTSGQKTPPQDGLKEDAVLDLVNKALASREAERIAADNITKVNNTLKQKFGEKASEVVANKAAELGLTPEDIKSLSAKSADAVLKLFGESSPSKPQPTTSSINLPYGQKTSSFVDQVKRPELNKGVKQSELLEYMAAIKKDVYARHGINT